MRLRTSQINQPFADLRFGCGVFHNQRRVGALDALVFRPCCGAVTHIVVRRGGLRRPTRAFVPLNGGWRLTMAGLVLDRFEAEDAPDAIRIPAVHRELANGWPAVDCHAGSGASGAGVPDLLALARKGMRVMHGDTSVGHVAEIVLDQRHTRIVQWVVRPRWGIGHTIGVPLDWVSMIAPRRIYLNDAPLHLAQPDLFRGDDQIAAEIRFALHTAPELARHNAYVAVDVYVYDGVAYLWGNVRTSTCKSLAGKLAERAAGVRHICNELIADGELAREVRAVLARHALPAAAMEVDVTLGRVALFGTVVSATERARAVATIQRIPGVQFVTDDLMVQPGDLTDDVLAAAAVQPAQAPPAGTGHLRSRQGSRIVMSMPRVLADHAGMPA